MCALRVWTVAWSERHSSLLMRTVCRASGGYSGRPRFSLVQVHPRYRGTPPSVVTANLLHGFGQCNLRKPRRQEREVGCQRGKAFTLPPCSADRHNRIAHQTQRSPILTSSPLSALPLSGSQSLLRRCHTARELSLVLQNKTGQFHMRRKVDNSFLRLHRISW